MTATQALLLPFLLHFVLTGVIGIRLGRARVKSVMSGETRLKDIALDNRAWPEHVRKLGNNFDNQFQLPVMWYATSALVLAAGLADWIMAAFAWLFLLARAAHSYIHTGSNAVRLRFNAFLASFAALAAMWLWFAIRLYIIG
jgi:hypothetical protein